MVEDEEAVEAPLPRTLLPMAPRVLRAIEEEARERFVGTPLTSLSVSSVGSLLTNSFCSKTTTTYGRALIDRTLRPLAAMSLTCIWPLEEAGAAGVLLRFEVDACAEPERVEFEEAPEEEAEDLTECWETFFAT